MEISAVRKCFWCLTNKINQINVDDVSVFIFLLCVLVGFGITGMMIIS